MNAFHTIVAATANVRGIAASELLHFLCERAARKHGPIAGIQQAFRACFFTKFHK